MSYHAQSRRRAAMLSLALAGVGACASSPATIATMSPGAQSASVAASVRNDAHILAVLHTSNVGEIAAATVAQQRGTDSAVKAFAMMMMTEHSTLDQQGQALGQQIGVTPALPDSTLPGVQRVESDSLRAAASGPAFDQLYMAQQVVAHQRTLNLIDASLPIAQHGELKTALQSQVRPAVQRHLTQAREIQTRIGGATAAAGAGAGNAARNGTTTGTSAGSVTESSPGSANGAGANGSSTSGASTSGSSNSGASPSDSTGTGAGTAGTSTESGTKKP